MESNVERVFIERPVFYFVATLYVLTILISGGDTYNYFVNGYGALSWVNLGLNIGLLLVLPFFLKGLINVKLATGIVVYSTMIVIFFTNFFLREVGIETWENNYLRDIPILFVYMFALCIVLSARHLVVFNLFHITYCIFIYLGTDSKYIEENTIIIVCALLGFSYIMYFFLNRLKMALKQNTELKEKIRLEEKQTLKDKLAAKDRELTFQAMMLASNSESSEVLLNRLSNLKKNLKEENKREIQGIISEIKFVAKKDIWNEFQLRFSEVHQFFAKNLLADFPDLTPNDIKLASLLKLDLSSKEISILIGNTKDSVDVSRSRLRKKLNLNKEDSLSTVLNKY